MRGKELTNKQREQIICAHLAGVKGRKIALNFKIPQTTVYDTIKRYYETNSPHPKKRPGRPKVLTNRDKRALQQVVLEIRFSPLGEITNEINNILNTTHHSNTVRKYINEIGFGSRIPRKKPLLTSKQEIH